MLHEIYHFNWNATDASIKQRQESSFEKLLEIWLLDTDEVFATTQNFFDALFLTHQTLGNNLILGGFVIFRAFVKIASKIILLSAIAPRTAERTTEIIRNWGEEKNEPWTLATFHENIING